MLYSQYYFVYNYEFLIPNVWRNASEFTIPFKCIKNYLHVFTSHLYNCTVRRININNKYVNNFEYHKMK